MKEITSGPAAHFLLIQSHLCLSWLIYFVWRGNSLFGETWEMETSQSQGALFSVSTTRSKAKRLNLHSVLTILHYPNGHALAITQTTFLSEWHLGHLSQ